TRLGVWPHLLSEAAPLKTLRIVDGTRRLFRAPEVAFESGEIGLAAFGYNLPNAILTAALEREIAERGITVVDAMAEGAEVGRDGVTISTPRGPVTAALVVAADGRLSRMRYVAGIPVEEWRYEQSALVCNLRHTEPHHQTSTEFHTEAGPFTL